MSKYQFSLVNKKVTFQTTFLQSVVLRVTYDCLRETRESFRELISSYFKVELTDERYDLKNIEALRLQGYDSKVRYKFGKGFLELFISGDFYVNFESSVRPFLLSFADFLKVISSKVESLRIEKVNIWPLNFGQNVDSQQFLNAIFSPEILRFRQIDGEGLSFIETSDDDRNNSMAITFGFIPADEAKSQPSRLVLDTTCRHNAEIKPDFLVETASKVNQDLYSAYMWSVTDDVITAMKELPV